MINFRSLKRIGGPSVEPVSLAEAKAHLRVDIEADDSYIAALITAARIYCEDYLDRSLIYTQWQMRLDGFPPEIAVPRPPMAAAGTHTAVTVVYTESSLGNTTTMQTSSYRVDRDATPGAIRTLYGQSWPSHLNDMNSITVTWWAGYGSSGSSVPNGIRHAMLMMIGTWYERRQSVDSISSNEVPMGAKALLDMNKWGAYR